MRLLRQELKINRKTFMIWLLCIAFCSVGCIVLYHSLEDSVKELADSYSNMGAMSQAIGMDKLSLATMEGYYGTEIAIVFNLGVAMFAALIGIGMLSKEENGHTAEFLNALPVSRVQIYFEKYAGLLIMIVLFNLIQVVLNYITIVWMNQMFDIDIFVKYHIAAVLMQVEIASVCYMISAITKRTLLGAGLGFAILMFGLEMMCRIIPAIEDAKYITPFYYCNAADIFSSGKLDTTLLGIGCGVTVISIIIGVLAYQKKDIAA
ncbi:MAG: ABC transporter permease subunit [Eubacteriales bacterium]|nr:ABC transporter permease subunit [Eubacteriales bacterium]